MQKEKTSSGSKSSNSDTDEKVKESAEEKSISSKSSEKSLPSPASLIDNVMNKLVSFSKSEVKRKESEMPSVQPLSAESENSVSNDSAYTDFKKTMKIRSTEEVTFSKPVAPIRLDSAKSSGI